MTSYPEYLNLNVYALIPPLPPLKPSCWSTLAFMDSLLLAL